MAVPLLSPFVHCYKYMLISLHLKGRERKREPASEHCHWLVNSPDSSSPDRVGPGQSREPGSLSVSPTWANTVICCWLPSGYVRESWSGNGEPWTWNCKRPKLHLPSPPCQTLGKVSLKKNIQGGLILPKTLYFADHLLPSWCLSLGERRSHCPAFAGFIDQCF